MGDNLTRILRREGYRCSSTTEARKAVELLQAQRPDLLLTDLNPPETGGRELLGQAHGIDPALPVIMITAVSTIESAVTAVKHGAFDYLPRDFSADQLRVSVARALRERTLQVENRNLRARLEATFRFEALLGRSAAMARVFELVRKAARSDASILVTGESGTGKELVARAVHANSPRAAGPFVPVDCASLPEPLLESELFGHEKGAVTGAVRARPGSMESAHRGTLFLDEVGELPRGLQARLVRTLQERPARRVGGHALVDVDVRVVAATTRDLRAAAAKRDFRGDLFYRIDVIGIELPPLREREGDVRLLAHAFLERFGRGRLRAIDDDALAALERYRWPGNVRELQNMIERACALADGDRVRRGDLPDYVVDGASAGPGAAEDGAITAAARAAGKGLALKDAREHWMSVLEASYLGDLLAGHEGNISAAAKTAGIDRKTFHRLLNKHRLKSRPRGGRQGGETATAAPVSARDVIRR
ncbi:MAG: sigma-54-dependent Fis family transcriptional regulator [Candidatus Rokubacteria bacterium]|nr:sigma-54-dependent Fis family transcriptional regulator [Candidatus Rokubacteria bacterium]